MNFFSRLFSRPGPEPPVEAGPQNDPALMLEPETAHDFQRRGYAYYSRSLFKQAEADFRKAIELDRHAVDSIYALGMTLKAADQGEEAVKIFRQAISLLDAGVVPNRTRYSMLRRMALGHINEITQGDWNLEKEIWKRVE